VYYGALVVLLAVLAPVLWSLATRPAARAQIDVTIEASMTKGPAGAPVTILEFSDYQ
jgi:hypothetical protein